MALEPNQNPTDQYQALLEENLRLTKAIYTSTEKTRRYIMWGQVFGFLKIIIIVVPLILAYVYLQPMLQQALGTYQQLLGSDSNTNSQNSGSSSWLDQLKALQNSGQVNSPK